MIWARTNHASPHFAQPSQAKGTMLSLQKSCRVGRCPCKSNTLRTAWEACPLELRSPTRTFIYHIGTKLAQGQLNCGMVLEIGESHRVAAAWSAKSCQTWASLMAESSASAPSFSLGASPSQASSAGSPEPIIPLRRRRCLLCVDACCV